MHRSRLPILDPCHERWDAMPGTRTRRHCEACDRDVIDLSAMHAEAAIDTLLAHDGRVCVRLRVDAAGDLRFAPPPPPRPAAALVAALLVTACAGWDSEPETVVPGELGMCTPEQELAGTCEPGEPPPSPKPKTVDPPAPACDLPDTSATDRAPRDVPLAVTADADASREMQFATPADKTGEEEPVLRAEEYGEELMGVVRAPSRRTLKQMKREVKLERRMQRRARRLGE